MTADFPDWIDAIAAAAAATRASDAPALRRAEAGLRLAWSTIGGVGLVADVDGEMWWLRLAEAVADAADEVDLIPETGGVRLGTGAAPPADLADTPQLRAAVRDLLAAVLAALRDLADQSTSDGRRKLATTLAVATVARALGSEP
jgi:hypothetical protein